MHTTTEIIYFGGYALVIGVSLVTVIFAKRAENKRMVEAV